MADAARRFVQGISKEHGYLGEEVYARMDSETRRQVEEALLKKDEMIGASVTTLAKNLYSKDVRFLFELLQNADDNNFSHATAANHAPYVSFRVYKDRIVVDCNEDGFTKANIQAICNVGQSSKTGAQGYIGEKGIGFKSVFKVAWKVHIQSGHYSFTFTHRKGDSGMGMISPEWYETTERLAQPLTRTTLYLHESNGTGNNDTQRQSILHQLHTLQPAMLLFLNKLKSIHVHIHDQDGEGTSSFILSKDAPIINKADLSKVYIDGDGKTTHTNQAYRVVRGIARNLPRNENREYTTQEERSKAYGDAPVVLAFPLTNTGQPVIEPQEVFAFLPVRRVGFNFLIHSDFVTQANREDIVTTSPRNCQLLDTLAETFIIGMREFCQDAILKYHWMRYLPKLSDYPWDPFWRKLVDKIKDRITDEDILLLRDGTTLRKISRAERLYSTYCDQLGLPLFDDLSGNLARYLSQSYGWKDLDLLSDYGLDYMAQDQFIARVRNDLSSPTSRMRSPSSSDDWHERAARCLSLSFRKGWTNRIAETKELKLIPLIDGSWVDSRHDVYFAVTSNCLKIPTDLGLSLVHPDAAKLADRKQLFRNLGVKYASVEDIRTRIFQRYKPGIEISIDTSRSHLEFLYRTCDSKSFLFFPGMFLYNTLGVCLPTEGNVFYLVDNARYGLWELHLKVDENKRPRWPGIHFLSEKYFENPPNEERLPWKAWLHLYLGVRKVPRLVVPHTAELSEECLFVAEHLSSELLGFLRYSWSHRDFSVTPEHMDMLKALEVPCLGGQLEILSKTYLPSTAIFKRHNEFMRLGEFFPILDIRDDFDTLSQDDFLREIGVKDISPDLDFYLDVLYYIKLSHPEPSDLVDSSRILRLYLRILAECLDPSDEHTREERKTRVIKFFEEEELIFVPSWGDRTPEWASPDDCLLDGPIGMRFRHSIFPLYHECFVKSGLDFQNLKKFLSSILAIRRTELGNIMSELGLLKAFDPEQSEVLELYKYLDKMRCSDEAWKSINSEGVFENEALIFADSGLQKWYKLSQCLWSAPASIRGKINLSTVYDDGMKGFFVNKLGVRMLDANIVYNELMGLEPDEAAVERVKDLLWTLNSQLEFGPPEGSADILLQHHILPIRHVGGSVSLDSSRAEFAIVDRKTLDDIFGRRLKVLDFTANEIHKLENFLKWAGLESRYLSRLVKESSVLDSSDKLPISDPTQDICKRAYGLLRIAVHFNSSLVKGDGQELYDLLRNLRTWETQRISTTLSVSLGGQTVIEEIDKGEVHIDDSDGLEIYVPHDETRREDAYISSLPNRLAKWMEIGPETRTHAASLIHGVLLVKVSQVNRYLNGHGIIEVTVPEQVEQNGVTGVYQSTFTLPSTPASAKISTSRREVSPLSEPRTPLSDGEETCFGQTPPSADLYTPSLGPGRTRSPLVRKNSPPDPYITQLFTRETPKSQEYRALLLQVASIARRSRLLDGTMNLSGLLDGLVEDPTVGGRSFNKYDLFGDEPQFECNKKVGAAGELFVFELLSSMNPSLGGFGRANWTSTIRKYATAHPEYADMDSWRGIETSDLQYQDDDGTLTNALISRGYLQRKWKNTRPRFYIEVKTTAGPWDTPFYMSNAQWTKLKDLSRDGSVCVIFRVYNLYSSRIGLSIYADPARLAEEGRLVFTADRWTVKPTTT
ncbi:hypothetical protein GGS23DRAFT_559520 [Durotheca rogersii]|uniref:uncharacterized protein n=1 Tax=Durotheca rogersii TaxID=419775 RepID=UPI002220E7C9|nr:uncharacterized protein GGS23DRAFT_559520 [Durotheca rogersii]KAI5865504.1 hypothetical protein GGS23DRAFT_559520 [Durotheca rogersii]